MEYHTIFNFKLFVFLVTFHPYSPLYSVLLFLFGQAIDLQDEKILYLSCCVLTSCQTHCALKVFDPLKEVVSFSSMLPEGIFLQFSVLKMTCV